MAETAWITTLEASAGGMVALLHQGAGSSIDHFLRMPLERRGMTILELDTGGFPEGTSHEVLARAALVVVVRYLPPAWLGSLRHLRRRGVPLAFLMDDDLLDPQVLQGLPKTYRRRLRQKITDRRLWVERLFGHVLVSSQPLAAKYAHLGAVRLPLCPHPRLLAEGPRWQLAYCGTAVHRAEFLWLRPLLEELQQRQDHTHIDLFGDLEINRLFRHIPRLRVLHPMDWERYLAATGAGRIDLLLCPLLETPFNHCRAPVKFIDAARSGAVGLYSDRPPYQGFIRPGIDGLLLPDEPACWIRAVEALLTDPERRQTLAAMARQRALALSQGEADAGDPGAQLAPQGQVGRGDPLASPAGDG